MYVHEETYIMRRRRKTNYCTSNGAYERRFSFSLIAIFRFSIEVNTSFLLTSKQHVNTWFVRTPVRVLLLFAEFCQILRSIATANTVINRLSCFVYTCYIIIFGATFTKETSEQTLGEGQKVHSVVP